MPQPDPRSPSPDPVRDRSAQGASAPRRRTGRGGLGCLARAGLGLLAFLVGAVLMLVFLGPPLAGRWVAREAEREFDRTRQGRLRLADLSLAWLRPQRVGAASLHGPDGVAIARAELELPSLVDLARAAAALGAGEPNRRVNVRLRLDADLVLDEDGTSNLERALAPRPGVVPGAEVKVERRGSISVEDLLRLLNAELLLSSGRLSVSTPQIRQGGVELALVGLEARLTATAGEPLRLVGSAASGGGGRLALDGHLDGLRETATGLALDSARFEASGEHLPTALIAAFLPGDLGLVELLGSALGGHLELDHGAGRPGRVGLELAGGGARARLALLEADGVLGLDPDAPSEATLALPRAWLASHLGPLLPAGVDLGARGEILPARVALRELSLPSAALLDPASFDPAHLRLALLATLGELDLAHAPTPVEGDPGPGPVELRIGETTLDLRLERELGLVSELRCDLEGGGHLRAEARAPAPSLRAALVGGSVEGLELDASATGFPTALVDALARQDGLLLDVLGPVLDASVRAREIALAAPAPPGIEAQGERLERARLEARLESRLGRVDFSGSLVGMRLVSTGDEGLNATARLSPLLSTRIVGPLLPLLVALEQPQGAPPLEIKVRSLSVPLAGEPGQIDALVRLELGDIRAQLLPTLAGHLGGVRELQPHLYRMLPLEVRVEQGLASYTALPLTLDGKTIELAGTFSLVNGTLDMRTELPLQHLGGEVRGLLRSVEEFVSPDLAVPVSLLGTLSRPRLRVPEAFVEQLVRDAARRGLEDQIQRRVREELEDKLPPAAREGLRGILERIQKKDG